MDILAIIKLLGGVGLFLYGMSLMGSSLEKLAGGWAPRLRNLRVENSRRFWKC